jgi:hypothetical protein
VRRYDRLQGSPDTSNRRRLTDHLSDDDDSKSYSLLGSIRERRAERESHQRQLEAGTAAYKTRPVDMQPRGTSMNDLIRHRAALRRAAS